MSYLREIWFPTREHSRSQWPRGLRRRSAAARPLRLWVWIPPGAWMFVCCECCVLSGRGLCDELITRPEESCRLWCVVVWDLETSRMRRPWPALSRSATAKKKKPPPREHNKVFKAITVLCLYATHSFVSIMLNLSIEGNLILHTKRTRSPCSTTDIDQSLNVNMNGHLDHQTHAVSHKIISTLSQST